HHDWRGSWHTGFSQDVIACRASTSAVRLPDAAASGELFNALDACGKKIERIRRATLTSFRGTGLASDGARSSVDGLRRGRQYRGAIPLGHFTQKRVTPTSSSIRRHPLATAARIPHLRYR